MVRFGWTNYGAVAVDYSGCGRNGLIGVLINNTDNNIKEIIQTITEWMFYNEDPIHMHLRKHMNQAYTREHMEAITPKIKDVVLRRMSEIPLNKEFDFVEYFVHPIPAEVLSLMVGLDEIDFPTFMKWADSLENFMQHFIVSTRADLSAAKEAAINLKEMRLNLQNLINMRREKPKSDLLTRLINIMPADKKRITDDEIISQIIHFSFGNHKVPQLLMSNFLHCFLSRKDLLKKVILDKEALLSNAIQEVMRYESPVQLITRHARKDFSMRGKHIRAGDSIYLMLGSANRDEEVFADADKFDIYRKEKKHIAFGSGVHICIAISLVKIEIQEMLSQFLDPTLEIQPLYDLSNPEWIENAAFHGIKKQPIKLIKKHKK